MARSIVNIHDGVSRPMPPIPPEQSSPYPGGHRKTSSSKPAQRRHSVGPVERHGDRGSGDEPPPTRYLTGPEVQRRYSINDVSLWRWIRDPRLKFPPPALVVNRRRYWDENSLIQWERRSRRIPATA
jgi:predicted DNA-binding transcriptional regulator AlpA